MSSPSRVASEELRLLPGGRIGVVGSTAWLSTAWGAFAYLVAAGGVMRLAARLGQRRLLHRMERAWGRAVVSFLRVRLDVEGLEQVDPRQSYLVLPLHEGFADVLPLLHLPLDLRFLVRDELFEWPLLGRHLKATGQLIVPEGGRAALRTLLRRGREALAAGESLVAFPQGSILGVEVAFRPGVARLIRALDHPVLPVVLTGSHRVWEYPFTPVLRFGCTISVRVLPPRPARSLDRESLRELERKMKRLALFGTLAPARRFHPELDGYWDGYNFEIDPDFPVLRWLVEDHRAGACS